MNTRNLLTRTVVAFVALSVAGIGVAISSRFVPDALEQTILVAVGSAIFGAGLTFFLVRIFAWIEKP
jgi:hypothetical protein